MWGVRIKKGGDMPNDNVGADTRRRRSVRDWLAILDSWLSVGTKVIVIAGTLGVVVVWINGTIATKLTNTINARMDEQINARMDEQINARMDEQINTRMDEQINTRIEEQINNQLGLLNERIDAMPSRLQFQFQTRNQSNEFDGGQAIDAPQCPDGWTEQAAFRIAHRGGPHGHGGHVRLCARVGPEDGQ